MGLHNSRELKDVFSCVRIAFQKKICAYGQYSEFLSHDLSQTRSLELWKSNEISYAVLKKTRSSLCCIICLSYWFNTGKWRTREDSNLWPLTSAFGGQHSIQLSLILRGFPAVLMDRHQQKPVKCPLNSPSVWPECDQIRDERDTENKLSVRGAHGPPGGASTFASTPESD